MNNLLDICEEFLKKAKENNDIFSSLTKDNKVEIINLIKSFLKEFENKNSKRFLQSLLNIRDYKSKFYPEEFHPNFVDLFLDSNMWDWVLSSIDDPSNFDWLSAEYIFNDLKERLENDEIFQ